MLYLPLYPTQTIVLPITSEIFFFQRCIPTFSQYVFSKNFQLNAPDIVTDHRGFRCFDFLRISYLLLARRVSLWNIFGTTAMKSKKKWKFLPTTQDIIQLVIWHVMQELAVRGIQRKAQLPQREIEKALVGRGETKPGGGFIICQGFVRRGACRVFNERGRCSNHHPLDVHIVEIPQRRCPQVWYSVIVLASYS